MTNSTQENIPRSTSQVMSSMDQNYAMYEGQQQKSQVGESAPTSVAVAERSQSQLYPYPQLSQFPHLMSTAYDFRLQGSSTDPANGANRTVIEEVEASASMKALRFDEEIKNRIKQIIGESRAAMDGGQHNALQQAQHNALQQAQHQSPAFQHLQVQLQKQQQQMQRTGNEVSVPGSMSGGLPIPLPASVAAARAAGDVLYPALPQPSMLATTPEAIAERRAAVAAAVAAVPERAAAAAAAAAAKKSTLTQDLQNMGIVKPGTPPPADSRTPPPTLASLAALHVEPPPPYVSNPSLAAYRNAMLPQQPYSAHLANLMSGLSSSGFGNPALSGVPGLSGLSGLSGLPGLPNLPALQGLSGLSGAMTGVTSSAAQTLASLSLPSQLPTGLSHLSQPLANLNLPSMPSLPSALASAGLPSLSLPPTLSAPQPSVAPAWQNSTTTERENNSCHAQGVCHASQPMAMIPMPVMSIPMHMHPCCPSPWMGGAPVVWMGNPSCCSGGNGVPCPSGGQCCQTSTASTMPSNFPLGFPAQRQSFQMPNALTAGLAQTGPPGYRIPSTLNPTRSAVTTALNAQQPLPEKPKAFQ